jgi:hypothetical protein
MGIQADKIHLTEFLDDLGELLNLIELQPGKKSLMAKARASLLWPAE